VNDAKTEPCIPTPVMCPLAEQIRLRSREVYRLSTRLSDLMEKMEL
jgi:hypothetical protein